MPIDTNRVFIHRSTINTPDPDTDPVIATETNVNSSTGAWTESVGGWPQGRYYIYSVAEDLAGNKSNPSSVIGPICSFDANNMVSSSENWKIGEFNEAKIGILQTGGGS